MHLLGLADPHTQAPDELGTTVVPSSRGPGADGVPSHNLLLELGEIAVPSCNMAAELGIVSVPWQREIGADIGLGELGTTDVPSCNTANDVLQVASS